MKGKILGAIITVLVSLFLFFVGMDKRMAGSPIEAYQIYLNGEKIGLISSKEKLLSLIDNEQKDIKEKYKADKVYPPNGLDIKKVYTYNNNIVSAKKIYNKIKNTDPFTISGYTATITYTEKIINNDGEILEPGKPIHIYTLKKDIMKEALYKVASAFIGEDDLVKYEKGLQTEITKTGEIINSVYFEETITIKKDLVSTEEFIFDDADTLSRYLLFGTLDEKKNYVTKDGEDLETIADNHNLNIEELLIANPQYTSANVLLSAGENINVSLIKPLVSVIYRKTVVDDVKVPFKTKEEKDNSKYKGYELVKVKGQDGKTRITQEIKYTNGEIKSLTITNREVLVPAVEEVKVVGTKKHYEYTGYNPEMNVTGEGDWTWPTLSPFILTSRYKWRWGRMHQGIDISGTGHGSPIYAVGDGKVYKINRDAGKNEGLAIYVDHGNGWFTIYMHLSKIGTNEGANVKKGQRIGQMGCTGSCTGTHLHLGVFKGAPFQGGYAVDPCNSIFKC